MLYVVTYMCTIVGAYSCAVDANQCVRSLRRVGCMGATVCEVRLNSETPTCHAARQREGPLARPRACPSRTERSRAHVRALRGCARARVHAYGISNERQ